MKSESFEQFLARKKKEMNEEAFEREARLAQMGGIIYELEKDSSTGIQNHFVNLFGEVRIPTYIRSQEEVDEIRKSIVLSTLARKMFVRVAMAFALDHSIMLEGDPGTGKTFCYQKLNEFIHGKGNDPLILFCGRHLAEPDIQNCLLEAYIGNGGRGRMLLVDHFNLLSPDTQSIFRPTIGKLAKVSDSIRIGPSEHKKGVDTYIGYAQNFHERTQGTHIVEPGMTDRLEWYVIDRKLAAQQELELIRLWGSRKISNEE